MNIAFTRQIRIRGLLREVNFRRRPGEEAAYHVDTTDERGNRIMFSMNKGVGGSWQLSTPDLPPWIGEAEGLLATAIAAEEAGR